MLSSVFSYLPPVKDVLGLRTPGVYIGSHVNAVVFILDKVVDPSKSEPKSTTDI